MTSFITIIRPTSDTLAFGALLELGELEEFFSAKLAHF